MTPVLSQYLHHLIEQFRHLDSRGVMQVARLIELDLEEVFVQLKLRTGGQERLTFSLLEARDPRRSEHPPLEGLQVRLEHEQVEYGLTIPELLQRSAHWVILGDPGAGKTTLLRFHAMRAARACLHDPSTRLPLFITLRQFAVWLDRNGPAEHEANALWHYWVEHGLAECSGDDGDRAALVEVFWQAIEQGNALFLLDGLDEQQTSTTKQQTALAIRALQRRHRDNQWLITSRIVGYNGALTGMFEEATLQSFSAEERNAFFHTWMWAVEKREDPSYLLAQKLGQPQSKDDEEFTRQAAARKSEILIQQIDASPGVAKISTNPLLCTIIGLIFLQGGALPDNRADLYQLCVDTYVFNWEMHKRRHPQEGVQLDRNATLAVLERLALEFHEHRPDNRAPRDVLVDLAARFLSDEYGEAQTLALAKADNLFKLITVVAGVFIERGNDEYGFFHLTFQEYLAARYITRARRRIRDYLAAYAFDPTQSPRWREVFRLAAIHQGQHSAELGSEFVDAVWYLEPPPPHDEVMQYRFRFAFLLMCEARVERETRDTLCQRWMSFLQDRFNTDFLWLGVLRESPVPPHFPEDAVSQLQRFLQAPEAPRRRAAAIALGRLRDPRALNELVQALQDHELGVSSLAAWALGRLTHERAWAALMGALQDEGEKNVRVRRAVVEGLGHLHEPRAVDALLRSLSDPDVSVQFLATEALGLSNDMRAFESLLSALQSKDPAVRAEAGVALAHLQVIRTLDSQQTAGAFDRLHETLLGDSDLSVRQAAIRALGRLRDEPRAFATLIAVLQHNDLQLRLEAVPALGTLRAPGAFDILLKILAEDPAHEMRYRAARALGELGDPRAVDMLLPAARRHEMADRLGAIEALGKLGDPRAVDALVERLTNDEEWPVRRAAVLGISQLAEPDVARELLWPAMQDRESWVRTLTALTLGRLRDRRALDALLEILENPDSTFFRDAAAEAIETIDLGAPL